MVMVADHWASFRRSRVIPAPIPPSENNSRDRPARTIGPSPTTRETGPGTTDGATATTLTVQVPAGVVLTRQATEADSVAARNVTNQRRVRLGLGPTRDVVMIDAELEQVYGLGEAPAELGWRYAAQADWDPRESG